MGKRLSLAGLAAAVLLAGAVSLCFLAQRASRDRTGPRPGAGETERASRYHTTDGAGEIRKPGDPSPPIVPAAPLEAVGPSGLQICVLYGTLRERDGAGISGGIVKAVPVDAITALAGPECPAWQARPSEALPGEEANDLERAREKLLGESPSARSDAQGSYEISGLTPCLYRVFASAPEYLSSDVVLVPLTPAEKHRQDFELDRGAVVAGRVVDPEGTPVRGARVLAEPSRFSARGFGLALIRRTRVQQGLVAPTCFERETDKNGEFSFACLDRERYDFSAEAEGFARARVERVAPEARDLELRLQPGGILAGELRVEGKDSASVSVEIQPDSSRDAVGFTGGAQRMGEGLRDESRVPVVQAPGRFEIRGLSPGPCGLRFRAQGLSPSRLGPVEVPDCGKLDLGTVVLETDSPIRGQVRDAANRAVEGAVVRAVRAGSGRSDWQGLSLAAPALRETRTDPAGAFALAGLPAEELDIEVWSPVHSPALRSGVSAGTTGVDFLLEPGAGLCGIVLGADSGKPVAGARIRVPPAQEASSGPDGRFSICGLPSGGEPVLLFYSVTAAGYREKCDQIRWRPGDAGLALTVRLAPLISLRGIVLSPTRAPVAGATVHLVVPGAADELANASSAAATDERGRFEMAAEGLDVRGGPRLPELVARHPEYAEGRSGPLAAGDCTGEGREIEIHLTSGGSIGGRVLDGRGVPLEGGIIELSYPLAATRSTMFADALGIRAPIRTTRSSSSGAYLLERVAAGEYLLHVRIVGFGPASRSVIVREGAHTDMDIELPDKKTISGRIFDAARAPLDRAEVIALRHLALPGAGAEDLEIVHACAAGLSRTTSGPDGRYELKDLPAVAVKVVARLSGFELAFLEDVAPGAVGIDLVLLPLASLQLRVADEATGAPVPTYRADLRYLGHGGRGELLHPWNRRGLGRREVQSSDGRVTMPGVPSGRHELRLEAEGFMARSESLSLLPGERRELTVILSRGNVIRGRVWSAVMAAPLRGATVTLRTAERSPGMTGNALSPSGTRTTTGADGAFEFRGVPEGLVVLTAKHSSHLPWSKEIQVVEDTVIDDIELQAAALLSLELKGIESTSAQVVLEPLETGSDRRSYSLVPMAGDRYLGTSLPGGAYMLLVRWGGEEFRRGPIALHEGREEKVSVTLGLEKH